MSDFEDMDFLMESWTSTEKKKRKKGSNKDKKGLQLTQNVNMKKQECIQKKKKKKTKFKEAMETRKDKKKEKKKKKKKVALDNSVTFTQKPEASKPSLNERLDCVMADSMKSTKRKKKVTLDLVPHSIHVKRLKSAVSESCSQVTAGHTQVNDNDSQCTSDDINSQDLFITQKTFRLSASEPSSEEAKAFTVSPLTQRDKPQQISVAGIEGFYEYKCLQDSRQTNTERRGTFSFQTQKESKSSHTNEKIGSSPQLNMINAYLDEPLVVKPLLKVGKTKTSLLRSPARRPQTEKLTLLRPSTTSTSTQTENFFTSELTSYLHFCNNIRATVCYQDVKPLDLSLKQRLKKDLVSDLSGESKHMYPSDSSQVKGVKKEHSGRGVTTLSPQSESEHKSTNTSNSSEASEAPGRTSKLDLNQIRAVQMRLNESFFFKSKGYGKSPRPESPLMKLVQGRENKNKKDIEVRK